MAANGFQHLTFDERRSLFRMQEARLNVTEMKVLAVAPRQPRRCASTLIHLAPPLTA